ncbi:MAG: fused MFS/spermidine synthase [Gemmataceae bacterium]
MPLLFAVTLFLSASLLFMVQPMVGKMILPLLGGSPAVWNACMVFFQALLLLGYQYSHLLTSHYKPKKQWFIHIVVLAFPVTAMILSIAVGTRHTPIAVAESLAPSGDTSPFLAVMLLMSVAIGLPFFVASTTTPLIQSWFAATGHPASKDPYFLNAVGNAGSLISLLGYPLFIEPNLPVSSQTWLFATGFSILVVLLIICGKLAANPIGTPPPPSPEKRPQPKATAASEIEDAPSTLRVLKWVAFAFVPSSWMLGVTFYMTTDIASIPLLWVLPLALYLVTFIIAFSRVPPWFRLVIGNLAPVMILLLVFIILAKPYMNSLSTAMELTLHIAAFFAVAQMCHYELAIDRPKNIDYLTKYYLMMSLGGVLGGLFNALIAPMIFVTALEYYVTMGLACLLVPSLLSLTNNAEGQPEELLRYKRKLARILDFALPILTGGLFLLFVGALAKSEDFHSFIERITTKFSFLKNSRGTIFAITLVAVPVMSCFFFVDRAQRFALAVSILLGIHLYRERDEEVVYTERTFFGILKVEQRGVFTRLVHGTTLHGTQINQPYLVRADAPVPFGSFSPWDVLALEGAMAKWDPRQEPLTYYHRTGPVGAMFYELRTRKNGVDAKAHVAMIGLGTGSASCYALPGQKLTFYEIDAGVKKLVADQDTYFSYVKDAERRGGILDFRMGDARLKIKEDADRKYALLLVDAFSSDSIPVHLLTKEAVELYLNRMTDDGILALHISNKFVSLEPVVAKIAEALKLEARVWNDNSESRPGKTASSWVVLAKDVKTLGVLARPANEQVLAFGTKNQELNDLLRKYGPEKKAKEALTEHYGTAELDLEEFTHRFGPQAATLYEYTRKTDLLKQEVTLDYLRELVYGDMFRTLRLSDKMPLWTDDYSDVLRVMMLKEVVSVRKFFGLPTLETDE